MLLNEPAPGWALAPPLLAAWLAAVAIPVLRVRRGPRGARRRRPPVALLRGGRARSQDARRRSTPALCRLRRPAARAARCSAAAGLGVGAGGGRARAWSSRPALTLGLSTAFVLLMLALASDAQLARDRPERARQALPADRVPARLGCPARCAGSRACRPSRRATRSRPSTRSRSGETIDVIAYPGNHTVFEAPPLVSGHAAARRRRGGGRPRAGGGARARSPGSTLAIDVLVRQRAAAARRGRRQLARSRRSRRLHARGARCLRADPSARSTIARDRAASGRQRRRGVERALLGDRRRRRPPPPARPRAACRSSPCSARSCARSRSSTGSSACTR